jgi:hypothetical protein
MWDIVYLKVHELERTQVRMQVDAYWMDRFRLTKI